MIKIWPGSTLGWSKYHQGQLGNCWFVAAASVLAGVPTLWERVGILLSICKTGDYHHRNILMTKETLELGAHFFRIRFELLLLFLLTWHWQTHLNVSCDNWHFWHFHSAPFWLDKMTEPLQNHPIIWNHLMTRKTFEVMPDVADQEWKEGGNHPGVFRQKITWKIL